MIEDIPYPKYSRNHQVAGVYKIEHKATGGFYIGSSKDLGSRKSTNSSSLRIGKHKNSNLQALYEIDASIDFKVLAITDTGAEALEQEQKFISKHWGDALLLNVADDVYASFRGKVHSDEQIARFAEYARNRVDSPETSARKSKAQLGKKLSEDHKKKISESINKPEIIAKIKQANTGRKMSDEQKANLVLLGKLNVDRLKNAWKVSSSPVIIDNQEYGSIRKASVALGIPRNAVNDRLHDDTYINWAFK